MSDKGNSDAPSRAEHTTDFAGDAYRACLAGRATPRQQQSAASQIILLNSAKAELQTAMRLALALMDASVDAPDPWNSVVGMLPAGGVKCEERAEEVVHLLRTAIAKTEGPERDGASPQTTEVQP